MCKLALLIITLLIATTWSHSVEHRCVHDEITENFEPIHEDIGTEKMRFLQSQTVRPLKIHIDGSLFQGPPELKSYFVDKVLPVAVNFFSKRLSVLGSGELMKINSTSCGSLDIPANYRETGVDADLIFLVTSVNNSEASYLAMANACINDKWNSRPIMGQIKYNIFGIENPTPDSFESAVDVSLHEITHVLGFSKSLYKYWRKSFYSNEILGEDNVVQSNVTIRDKPRKVIKTPKVLEFARRYFNCSDLIGVELENDGGSGTAGSHWEKTILNPEIMTGTLNSDSAYSMFTLSLLEDSGWYKVDYSKAEPIFYGENGGCGFINQACKSKIRREFCTEDQKRICSFNFKHKGYCQIDSITENCGYPNNFYKTSCEVAPTLAYQNNWGETFGVGSKCVVGTIIDKKKIAPTFNSTLCYKYNCTSDGKIIFLPSGGGEIVCKVPGEVAIASGNYKGGLICPDPADYCKDYYPNCPNLCSSKGFCLRGACECRPGFTGVDCSLPDV